MTDDGNDADSNWDFYEMVRLCTLVGCLMIIVWKVIVRRLNRRRNRQLLAAFEQLRQDIQRRDQRHGGPAAGG